MNSAAREHFVYWLFAADGACLYVGCTKHPERRWREHVWNRKEMVAETYTCRMAGPYTFAVARRLERAQQDVLKPRYDFRLRGVRAAVISRRDARRMKLAAKLATAQREEAAS